jgi:hypothetical protein
MRKFIVLTAFLLVAVVTGVMAQGTYLLPLQGETHTYEATVTDPGSNNPVRWYVTTDAAGTIKADTTTDFIFETAGYVEPDSALTGTAVYSVDITWKTTATPGAHYYVFLEVDDDVSGCANRMALDVQISADFNAVVYDVTGSSTPGTVYPTDPGEDIEDETCPDDVENPIWDGSGHTDIGYSEIVYRVEKEFSVLAWQFEYAITEADGDPFTIENVRIVDEGSTKLYNGTLATQTISGIGAAVDYVLMYIQITNQQGVELTIDVDLLSAEDTATPTPNTDSNPDDNHADHVIQPMPEITGFGGS